MKAFILVLGIAISGLIAISKADKSISGTWLMKQGDSPTHPPVLRVKMEQGIWEGRIDMPEQEVYDKQVHSVRVNGDSVFITVYPGGPVMRTRMLDSNTIAGQAAQEGRVDAVLFKKI